jgi:fructose-1,6-bisphosphatase
MPDELHQRTPLFIGSKEDVQTARELLKDEGRREERRKNPQV